MYKENNMKLAIFGSTGSIGRQLVKQAIEEGHTVTAFARSPDKLETGHNNLKVVPGDVMNLPTVEKAVLGQDAILCSLGAGLKGTVRSEGTKHIVQAMEKAGVRRFICQTTLGLGDSWNNLNFYWKYIMFKGLLRQAYADHVRQEEIIRQSNLDWTIVRPGAFTDGPRTGTYRHGFPGSDKMVELKISRADVADFMLKQLADDTYLRKMPGLSY
jgi:putative NADH-flavin reductase